MAIKRVDDILIILNANLMWDSRVMDLPIEASMETAIWLDALYTKTLLDSDANPDFLNSDQLTKSQQRKLNWVTQAQSSHIGLNSGEVRAWYACLRTYKQPLVSTDKRLTETGLAVAEQIYDILSTARQKDKAIVDPKQWTQADQAILRGRLTWRQVGLLAIIYAALDEAIARYDADTPALPTPERTAGADLTLAVTTRIRTESPMAYLSGDINNYAETVHAIAYVLNAKTPDNPDITAFVPMSSLGGKGRTDTAELAKLGLIDIRTVHDGSRGRPKVGISPTRWGTLLLRELTLRHLI